MEIFQEISLILLLALIVSTVMRYLKQPLIIGYIFTGLIVGPSLLNVLSSTETVELFSKIGITSLLFIVGLGLSPKVIKELGIVSLATGLGQVVFTSVVGYFLGIILGFTPIQAIYISIALTFSSTIIILKLLSDKGDLNKLYGRIAVGFLLVQDLVATIILVIISSISKVDAGSSLALELFLILLKGFVLLIALFYISSFLLKKFTNFLSNSQEYLFIFGLSWGLGIASVYHLLGLSVEIGALVAGVTLSMAPFAVEISSRLKPLRDFFIILFFILLGYNMSFDNWQNLLVPTILFSVFILIGNPIIMQIIMNLLGYKKRVGFMTGLTVAQISEFSLILITLGYTVGHLSKEILSMVTMIGIITISASTYLILYSDKIYQKVEKYLNIFEFRKTPKKYKEIKNDYDAMIFGYRRAGPEFAQIFTEKQYKFLVIDFDPNSVRKLEEKNIKVEYFKLDEFNFKNIKVEYGDMSDLEFLNDLPLSSVKLIVSTVSDFESNYLLLKTLRKVNQDAVVIIIADTLDHSLALYEVGATHVVLSHYIGAHYAANMILQKGHDIKSYDALRNRHIKYLEKSGRFRLV